MAGEFRISPQERAVLQAVVDGKKLSTQALDRRAINSAFTRGWLSGWNMQSASLSNLGKTVCRQLGIVSSAQARKG